MKNDWQKEEVSVQKIKRYSKRNNKIGNNEKRWNRWN
jgi:hypothetical protein